MMSTTRYTLLLFPLLLGQAFGEKAPKNSATFAELKPPAAAQRALRADLLAFGEMIRSYHAVDEKDVVIEIDILPNDSGIDKELPSDIGFYTRQAIEDMGPPFRSYRTWPYAVALNRPGAQFLPSFTPAHPAKPPRPDFRVVGNLLRASEITIKGKEIRFDILAGKADGQASRERRTTITNVAVGLGLDGPDGLSVRGATARYQILVERNERNISLSLFIAGTGLGGGTKLIQSHDIGDALYDATAAILMHLLGHAFQVPYYRCSNVFAGDSLLDERYRDSLKRQTREELEQTAKRFLYVSGHSMDLTKASLTVDDRALVKLEMQRRNLLFHDTQHMAAFVYDLWKSLNFVRGAQVIGERMSKSVRDTREAIAAAAQKNQTPTPAVIPADLGPQDFEWPRSTKVVVLDLSRVADATARDRIIAYARQCQGCLEVRSNQQKTIVGVRMASEPFQIQRSLRLSPLRLAYVWAEAQHPRLVLALQ